MFIDSWGDITSHNAQSLSYTKYGEQSMNNNEGKFLLQNIIDTPVSATANIKGKANSDYEKIIGTVDFYQMKNGTILVAVIHNLPQTASNFFAFHIHENGECSGDFLSAGGHLGEGNHPYHIGDLPLIIANNGEAFSVFFDNRFDVEKVISKSIIIHGQPDDYTSQPAGNSGERIACGVILKR